MVEAVVALLLVQAVPEPVAPGVAALAEGLLRIR